jgi:hypothetical protein
MGAWKSVMSALANAIREFCSADKNFHVPGEFQSS